MARGREDRKYLISAESRKSQHKAFCVIKPLPQKLYGFTKRSFPLYSSPGERVMVPLGNANRNAGTRKAEKKIKTHTRSVQYYIRRFIYFAVVFRVQSLPRPYRVQPRFRYRSTRADPVLRTLKVKRTTSHGKSFRTILIRFQNRTRNRYNSILLRRGIDTPLFIDRRLAERIF